MAALRAATRGLRFCAADLATFFLADADACLWVESPCAQTEEAMDRLTQTPRIPPIKRWTTVFEGRAKPRSDMQKR